MFPFDDVIMWYFADGIFKCIFVTKIVDFLLKTYFNKICYLEFNWEYVSNGTDIVFPLKCDSQLAEPKPIMTRFNYVYFNISTLKVKQSSS